MRGICWVVAVLAGCILADAAAGYEPTGTASSCPSCNGTTGTFTAPACCFPGFGLVPGCCESRPTCCDHVWDGYCQGKAWRLQRHYMHAASRPCPPYYGPPTWPEGYGMMESPPDAQIERDPETPVPLPDPNTTTAP